LTMQCRLHAAGTGCEDRLFLRFDTEPANDLHSSIWYTFGIIEWIDRHIKTVERV
jgi:hypothetical protein